MGQVSAGGWEPSAATDGVVCCSLCSVANPTSTCVTSNCPSASSTCGVHAPTRAAKQPRVLQESEEWLLEGLPSSLAAALRETAQWEALRVRPWLSQGALYSLVKRLEEVQPKHLAQRYKDAEPPTNCGFGRPMPVPVELLEKNKPMGEGHLFKLEAIDPKRLSKLRSSGLRWVAKGKVAAVLLAGGASWRLGGVPPPNTDPGFVGLPSGKSLMALLCHRLRRVAGLCSAGNDGSSSARGPGPRSGEAEDKEVSVPLFVMTSPLTHQRVAAHFVENAYFGLRQRDVIFFQQPVHPLLDLGGRLLPQSLVGDFARSPGGTGEVLSSLASSGALQQMLDRGIEGLHVLGTENLLARPCDPVFMGFARLLGVDCAAKVTDREQAYESMELNCLRWNLVSAEADREEAAGSLQPWEGPAQVVTKIDPRTGELAYYGSMNSFFISVAYVQQAKDRPVRKHRVERPVPFLDFYTLPSGNDGDGVQEMDAHEHDDPDFMEGIRAEKDLFFGHPHRGFGLSGVQSISCRSPELQVQARAGLQPGAWPPENRPHAPMCPAAQQRLREAVREVQRGFLATPELKLLSEERDVWRCEVQLDTLSRLVLPRPRTAFQSSLGIETSLLQRGEEYFQTMGTCPPQNNSAPLACNLVIPRTPNAVIVEVSLLDYFAFSESVAMLHVPREREYAPVADLVGSHGPCEARKTMHVLHCSWLASAGAKFAVDEDRNLEISPLLSYEGEGLEGYAGRPVEPRHLRSPQELSAARPQSAAGTAAGSFMVGTAVGRRVMEALASIAETQTQRPAQAPKGEEPEEEEELEVAFDARPYYLQEYPERRCMSPSREPRFPPVKGGQASPRAVFPSEVSAPGSPSPSTPRVVWKQGGQKKKRHPVAVDDVDIHRF